jgi:tetraacyldisaccharide 4'-kinase
MGQNAKIIIEENAGAVKKQLSLCEFHWDCLVYFTHLPNVQKLMVKPERLPAKVISIGNITLGGTGKSPAVIAIAEEAKQGLYPCILTRGYKGK